MSPKVLQCVANYISEPLTHIFNLSLNTGKIPQELKVSLVTPVYKADDKKQLTNYRPISILTCFSKIFEKLMYKRLLDYIEKNNILYKEVDSAIHRINHYPVDKYKQNP